MDINNNEDKKLNARNGALHAVGQLMVALNGYTNRSGLSAISNINWLMMEIDDPYEYDMWGDALESINFFIDDAAEKEGGMTPKLTLARHIISCLWEYEPEKFSKGRIYDDAVGHWVPRGEAVLPVTREELMERCTGRPADAPPVALEQVEKVFPLFERLSPRNGSTTKYIKRLAKAAPVLLKFPPNLLGAFGVEQPNLAAAIEGIYFECADKLNVIEQGYIEELIYRLSNGESSGDLISLVPPIDHEGILNKAPSFIDGPALNQ